MLAIRVLLQQFAHIPELNGALRAGVHADGIETLGETILTGVALGHLLSDRIELRRAVGAGFGAHAAADALVAVNQDQTVFLAFEVSFGGAHLDAGGIFAVVAAHRNVIGKRIRVPCAGGAILSPAAAFKAQYMPEIAADGQVVFIFTGNLTRPAACAAGGVNQGNRIV